MPFLHCGIHIFLWINVLPSLTFHIVWELIPCFDSISVHGSYACDPLSWFYPWTREPCLWSIVSILSLDMGVMLVIHCVDSIAGHRSDACDLLSWFHPWTWELCLGSIVLILSLDTGAMLVIHCPDSTARQRSYAWDPLSWFHLVHRSHDFPAHFADYRNSSESGDLG